MTAQTATLTDFLAARFDDDEAAARKASSDSPNWEFSESEFRTWDIRTVERLGHPGYEYQGAITFDREGLSDSVASDAGPHIARHDPARVLAEVASKRRIVERVSAVEVGYPSHYLAQGVLSLLALPYADHPDFREEWRA